jgi:hypothetical protein
MSARDWVKNAEEELIRENHEGLELKADRPCPQACHVETDVTPELSDELANWHQQLISVFRWACELGRTDIFFEISSLASHAAMPRRGHLEAVHHVFACLKHHQNSTLVFDEQLPHVKESAFSQVDWGGFC